VLAMSEMDEIVKEFLVESNEGLDQLDRDLVALEKDPTEKELLASIFRAIHTVKGTSGVLGFPKIESVAHVGENLLSRMRDGKLRLDPEITSGLLAMVDVLRTLLTSIEQAGEEGARDVQPVVDRLAVLLDRPVPDSAIRRSQDEAAPLNPPARRKKRAPKLTPMAASESDTAEPQTSSVEPLPNGSSADPGETKGLSVSSNNIRVDVSLLDKMMNLVGELVLARNQILQFTGTQQDTGLVSTAQRLNLITTELQESVMKTRMQPIGNIWNKLPRLVRDLALSCGKQVRVEMDGAGTELDKTIIEAIKDPLTHIVRNAVDHGLETPEVRRTRGKQEEGRLLLRAYHEGGQVNIEISDDGGGIALEAVREKVRQKGLVSADQAARMSERELLNVIFLPGFSTAREVTNISGRGVGMDVVKTNIEKIGGTVDVQSAEGKGTTLKIKIPLTLAIIPALVATSGGERFAIPQVSLLELVRLEGEAMSKGVEYIHGAPVYRLRGNLLPLVCLNRVLGLSQRTAADIANIVVLQADGRPFGLIVDEINDTEEIVVKPLSNLLKGLLCFAGATIMGDGTVALILDVMGLAQQASVVTELRDHAVKQVHTRNEETMGSAEAWLLASIGSEARIAIPLRNVDRLEEFTANAVEHSSGGEVVQYRGQIMPLVRLADLLNVVPGARREVLPVVVSSRHGRSVGLVVDQIEDVTEQRVATNRATDRMYLQGSAVLQQRVTDLLDVAAVMASVVTDDAEVVNA
jgi:two-component system, chemotaxis family, sensor kinase CheA